MAGVAIIDGVVVPWASAALPIDDPAVTLGWSAFDTLLVEADGRNRIDVHLHRLARSAAALELHMPDPEVLRAEILQAASLLAAGDARVRVQLTGGGRRLVTAVPVETGRRHRGVHAVRGVHADSPYLPGAIKHTSRAGWVVAQRRSGVDEVLLVDGDGRFTEGTTCAVLAVIDGTLYTAPHDGRILESTTCVEILERAERAGVPLRFEGPPAAGPWQGLYVASTTRDLAPVLTLDGVACPGWDPVGRRLATHVSALH